MVFCYAPAALYIVLMFTTSLIPLNIYNAYILGLIHTGITDMVRSTTGGGVHGKGTAIARLEQTPGVRLMGLSVFLKTGYLSKFFMPRVISFMSLPKIITVPALVHSLILVFKRPFLGNSNIKLIFFLTWSFFLTFYFRHSHARYLFGATPLIIILFLLFIRRIGFRLRDTVIFIVTAFIIVIGLAFEVQWPLVKVFLNAGLLIVLAMIILASKLKSAYSERLKSAFLLTLAAAMAGAFFSANIVKDWGQIFRSLAHGYCGEIWRVVKYMGPKERIMTNLDGLDWRLVMFYRSERIETPEYAWQLASSVPKKKLLKTHPSISFKFPLNNGPRLEAELRKNRVNRIFLFESTTPKITYPFQKDVPLVKNYRFLEMERRLNLKNKRVTIYRLKNN